MYMCGEKFTDGFQDSLDVFQAWSVFYAFGILS